MYAYTYICSKFNKVFNGGRADTEQVWNISQTESKPRTKVLYLTYIWPRAPLLYHHLRWARCTPSLKSHEGVWWHRHVLSTDLAVQIVLETSVSEASNGGTSAAIELHITDWARMLITEVKASYYGLCLNCLNLTSCRGGVMCICMNVCC